MPDTRRELAALQLLFPDNTSGLIDAQDARDGWQTVHGSLNAKLGTRGGRPASGNIVGDVYRCSDAPFAFRWNGSAWDASAVGMPVVEPALSDFAWVNQGTATADDSHGGIVLTSPDPAGFNELRILKKAAPATPYTITLAFLFHSIRSTGEAGTSFGGACWRQSSDGKLVTAALHSQNSYYAQFEIWKQDSPTAYTASYIVPYWNVGFQSPFFWLRIADNGTNRITSISSNGYVFSPIHTVSRTDYLTANEVGFFVNGQYGECSLHLLNWSQG